jgi:hypothetical protein
MVLRDKIDVTFYFIQIVPDASYKNTPASSPDTPGNKECQTLIPSLVISLQAVTLFKNLSVDA